MGGWMNELQPKVKANINTRLLEIENTFCS